MKINKIKTLIFVSLVICVSLTNLKIKGTTKNQLNESNRYDLIFLAINTLGTAHNNGNKGSDALTFGFGTTGPNTIEKEEVNITF